MTADPDRLVRVKMFVIDDTSPLPTSFLANAWSAYDILLAYMNLYRGDAGGIVCDDQEWEGEWASPECFAFAQALVPPH